MLPGKRPGAPGSAQEASGNRLESVRKLPGNRPETVRKPSGDCLGTALGTLRGCPGRALAYHRAVRDCLLGRDKAHCSVALLRHKDHTL